MNTATYFKTTLTLTLFALSSRSFIFSSQQIFKSPTLKVMPRTDLIQSITTIYQHDACYNVAPLDTYIKELPLLVTYTLEDGRKVFVFCESHNRSRSTSAELKKIKETATIGYALLEVEILGSALISNNPNITFINCHNLEVDEEMSKRLVKHKIYTAPLESNTPQEAVQLYYEEELTEIQLLRYMKTDLNVSTEPSTKTVKSIFPQVACDWDDAAKLTDREYPSIKEKVMRARDKKMLHTIVYTIKNLQLPKGKNDVLVVFGLNHFRTLQKALKYHFGIPTICILKKTINEQMLSLNICDLEPRFTCFFVNKEHELSLLPNYKEDEHDISITGNTIFDGSFEQSECPSHNTSFTGEKIQEFTFPATTEQLTQNTSTITFFDV